MCAPTASLEAWLPARARKNWRFDWESFRSLPEGGYLIFGQDSSSPDAHWVKLL